MLELLENLISKMPALEIGTKLWLKELQIVLVKLREEINLPSLPMFLIQLKLGLFSNLTNWLLVFLFKWI